MFEDIPDWNVNPAALLWVLIGIPASLGWAAAGLGWLLDPHLLTGADPLTWAIYGAGAWYALLLLLFGGWAGLLIVTSLL